MAILNINTGINPNDGLGDSIRDAFVKVNSNTDFLEAARVEFASNISTGNLLVSSNLTAGGAGGLSGYYTYNGIEIATVGTTFSGGFVANPTEFQSTQDTTANLALGGVIVDGGLIVKKSTRANIFIANSATVTNLIQGGSFYTTGNANVASLNATGQVISIGNIRSTAGQLFIAGNITGSANLLLFSGNLWAGNVNATNFMSVGSNLRVGGNITSQANISGNYISGTLTTALQTNITTVGTLSNLIVAGNLTVNNSSTTTYLFGNVGVFDRVTLNLLPASPRDAASKDYVDIQAVAFGIALS
jgi:cytoskeletal protein CcmA (bactofilin family)